MVNVRRVAVGLPSQLSTTTAPLTTQMSIDLSLDRIRILLSQFETYSRPTIHVAGTNGKGSVCALLSSVFLACNPTPSVGRFNSPHLVDVTDSITINGEAVSRSTFDAVSLEVKGANDRRGIAASNFEVLTVTALLIFERHPVDVVVCEVGMGGRLDATNVIPDDAIVASVITSIDLDHQTFLGTTVAAIAREKAGIIRRNKPVILSQQKHHGVIGVVEEIARKQGAFLTVAPCATARNWDEALDSDKQPPFSLKPFSPPPPNPVSVKLPDYETYDLLLPLHGEHQRNNLGVVVAVLKVLSLAHISSNPNLYLQAADISTIRRGIRGCHWPGRLSFHSYKSPKANSPLHILADGAHNEAASQLLASYVSDLLKSLTSEGAGRTINLTYILALSHSPPKTPSSVILPLLGIRDALCADQSNIRLAVKVAALRFTPPSGMPWVKSVPPSEIQKIAEDTARASPDGALEGTGYWSASDAEVEDANSDLADALDWASQRSEDDNDKKLDHLVIVAGSLYLVADLYRLLNVHV